jgi:hypothetical protein
VSSRTLMGVWHFPCETHALRGLGIGQKSNLLDFKTR